MFRAVMLTLCLAMTFWVATSAAPNEQSAIAKKTTQEIADICWAISEDDRASGNTPRMRSGILNSARCLENSILMIASRYLNPHDAGVLAEYRTNLDQLRASYGRIVWNLYNTHAGCTLGCGTQFHTIHNAAYADLLTEIMTAAIEQVYTYNLDDGSLGAALYRRSDQNVHLDDTSPNAICSGDTCASLKIHRVRNIPVIEGYVSTQSHEASINGIIIETNYDSIKIDGTLIFADANQLDLCEKSGPIAFKKSNKKEWVLHPSLACLPKADLVLRR